MGRMRRAGCICEDGGFWDETGFVHGVDDYGLVVGIMYLEGLQHKQDTT